MIDLAAAALADMTIGLQQPPRAGDGSAVCRDVPAQRSARAFSATLTLPYPPSVNGYWRTPRSGPIAGRTLISEAGRKYRAHVGALIAARRAAYGLTGRLRVEIAMYAPDRRQRDLDNITKSLLDALTHAGVWADDGQIDDLRLRRERVIRGGQVVVLIEEIAPAVAQEVLL